MQRLTPAVCHRDFRPVHAAAWFAAQKGQYMERDRIKAPKFQT